MLAGLQALSAWNLGQADSAFGHAMRTDTTSITRALWRAQVRQWAARPETAWLPDAQLAVARRNRLSHNEALLATGLVALGTHQFLSACAAYDTLVAGDSQTFAGWYGLGECQSRDQVVLPTGEHSPDGVSAAATSKL